MLRLKHMLPYFGGTLVEDIGQEQVQEFITHLSRTTYTTADGVQRKLSPGYIRDIVSTLKRIIGGKAAHWDLTLPTVPYKEQRYFTQEEMLKIIAAATGKWKVLFALLADTGLRCGEAFGLHIEDLDLDTGRVFVRRSIWQGIEVTPKTRKGYRAVDVNPELCEMLKLHIGSRTTGYLLETRNGTPLCKGNSRRTLQEILKQLGIPKGGLHAFRHGRVSVLQSSGVPGDLIKEWVGHSSLRVTARYTHFTEKFRREEAKRTALLVSGSGDEAGLLAPDSPHGPQFSRKGDVNEMAKAVAA
jgi:integrase